MKKLSFILLAAFMFSACAATKLTDFTTGVYRGHTPSLGTGIPHGEAILSLNPDESFILSWLGTDYTGKWKLVDKKHMLLDLDEITDAAIVLQSGTLSGGRREIKIINKNKLEFIGWKLIRQ